MCSFWLPCILRIVVMGLTRMQYAEVQTSRMWYISQGELKHSDEPISISPSDFPTLMFLALCCLPILVSGYLQLDFTALESQSRVIGKRGDVEASIENRELFYVADFKVGSQEDPVKLWIDTRISLLWFPTSGCVLDSNSELSLAPFKRDTESDIFDCQIYGTFDPHSLSTFKNDSLPFYLDLRNGYTASGYWGKDTLRLGEFSGEMKFGVAKWAATAGMLGLGFPESVMYSADDSTESNVSFSKQLVESGKISRNTFALLLGTNNASEGQLLFGAVDHSKYDGTLQIVKMIDIYSDSYEKEILVILDGILGDGFERDVQLGVVISSSLLYLSVPPEMFEEINSYFNGTDDGEDGYDVDCALLNLHELVSLYFSGIEIQVPIRDIVYRYSAGCSLSITEGNGPIVLGQNVLKSAYVVVDMDNEEVAMAQAATTSKPGDIEDITSAIPLALQAPSYSYTSVREKYEYSDEDWYTSNYVVGAAPTYSTNTGLRSVESQGTEKPVTTGSAGSLTVGASQTTGSASSGTSTGTQGSESSETASSGEKGNLAPSNKPLRFMVALLGILSLL